LPRSWKNQRVFFWQGGKKISREFFKIFPIQNPKNTKNQKPKVQDLRTQRNSGFLKRCLPTYKRAQIKNTRFEKERYALPENPIGWGF